MYPILFRTILGGGDNVVQRGRSQFYRHGMHVEAVGIVRVQVTQGEGGMGLCLVGEIGTSVDLQRSDDVVSDDPILQGVLGRGPGQGERGGGDVG